MKKFNRKQFIGQAAMGLGSALVLSRLPLGMNGAADNISATNPIGFQTYPIRDALAKDFSGTMKMMAGLGYSVMEMCSPPGYADSAFGTFINMKPAEMRRIINEAGLTCPSCHFTFGELNDKLDDRIAFAKELGLSHMVCSSFWLPDTATLKDYLDACDKLNIAAEKISKAGMVTGYHNHQMEFAKRDGVVIYDAMMERLKPDLVKMQFQTEVINIGYKASTYFTKYPGRFISSHMSDWTADKKQVPLGKGIIDWKEFYATAPTGGVKHYFVEMDEVTFKESAEYLRKLQG